MELVTAEKGLSRAVLYRYRLPEFYNKIQPIEGSIIQIDKMMAYMRFKSKKVVSRGGIVISFE
jgi:predicted small secreted protein